MLSNRACGLVSSIETESMEMLITLMHDQTAALWLPDSAREEALVMETTKVAGWAAIGISDHIAVAAFINQPWVVSLVPYKGLEPGNGQVHIAPLSNDSMQRLELV